MIALKIIYIILVIGMVGQGLLFLFGGRWLELVSILLDTGKNDDSRLLNMGRGKLRALGLLNLVFAAGILVLLLATDAMSRLPVQVLLIPLAAYVLLILVTLGWLAGR